MKRAFKQRPNSPYGGETSSYSLLQQGVEDAVQVEIKLNEEEIDQNESEDDDAIVQYNTSSNVLVNDSTSTTKPMWKRNPDGSFSCTYEGN